MKVNVEISMGEYFDKITIRLNKLIKEGLNTLGSI